MRVAPHFVAENSTCERCWSYDGSGADPLETFDQSIDSGCARLVFGRRDELDEALGNVDEGGRGRAVGMAYDQRYAAVACLDDEGIQWNLAYERDAQVIGEFLASTFAK